MSSAAAQWQFDFASAVASEFGARVLCLSFLPIAPEEETGDMVKPLQAEGVTIIPVPRLRRWWGSVGYACRVIRRVREVRDHVDVVFCYNALIWTAPWAFMLARAARAPLVLIVADLEPMDLALSKRTALARLERGLLRIAQRFVLLSPATSAVLPRGSRYEVFGGLANETALRQPPADYLGALRFVYAGSLSEDAGVADFLAAAAMVARFHPLCEFHVFGRGTLKLTIPEELAGRAFIRGYVSDEELNTFLGRSCVGVNPRPNLRGENRFNAPYKLLYFCSRGIATITTLTPGVPDDIAAACITAGPGVEGLAAAMRSAAAMAPDDLGRMGREARAVIEATRSRGALASKLERLLSDPVTDDGRIPDSSR